MTQERKEHLFYQMFGWIGRRIQDGQGLFDVLHGEFGMSKAELNECGIEHLDSFFPEESARMHLEQKLKDCFEEYKNEWLGKSPATLIEEAEEIAAMQRMMRDLPKTVTEEDAAYLLRFQNPLEVVSDYWREENNSPVAENDRLTYILWEITDKQAAEQDYALEPEFQQSAPSQTQQQAM